MRAHLVGRRHQRDGGMGGQARHEPAKIDESGKPFHVQQAEPILTIANRERHQLGYITDVDAWLDGTKELQTWQSGELPALVIDSLVTGVRRELPVNIPNAGQCPDLMPDAVVESICIVDGEGIRGRDVARAPAFFAELLRRHVAVQEETVEAALSGDRRLAEAAFTLDPLAGRGDLHETEAMVADLLAGTSRWLPQFAGTG